MRMQGRLLVPGMKWLDQRTRNGRMQPLFPARRKQPDSVTVDQPTGKYFFLDHNRFLFKK
jgi:hypothetical protein